jgi:hypothetical protein
MDAHVWIRPGPWPAQWGLGGVWAAEKLDHGVDITHDVRKVWVDVAASSVQVVGAIGDGSRAGTVPFGATTLARVS